PLLRECRNGRVVLVTMEKAVGAVRAPRRRRRIDTTPVSGNALSESQTLRLLGGSSIVGATSVGSVSLGYGDGLDGHLLLRRSVAGPGVRALGGDIGDGLRALLVERPEDGVVGRQGTVVIDDEELGAVGVGTGVGHGQCAGRVGLG